MHLTVVLLRTAVKTRNIEIRATITSQKHHRTPIRAFLYLSLSLSLAYRFLALSTDFVPSPRPLTISMLKLLTVLSESS